MTQGAQNISKFIEHTLLRPEATALDFKKHFAEAVQHKFFNVCVPPAYISEAKKHLNKSDVLICSVIGFPFGYNATDVKAFAAQRALDLGADELDMVMNISAAKSGNWKIVLNDIRQVVRVCRGKKIKVIIETGLLSDEEKIMACKIASEAGAHFIKTSTGFGPGGATLADIKLIKANIPSRMQIKASGGIRDFDTAKAMLDAGAHRIGTNSSVAIVTGHGAEGDY
jgi:deoxyribose-phosphate aldolase